MATRPKTMREISAEKKNRKDIPTITISNISKQLIKIHLDPPIVNGKKLDFYVGAQDIELKRNQTHTFRKDRIRMDQVTRLQKMGYVSIVHDNVEEDNSTEKKVEVQ